MANKRIITEAQKLPQKALKGSSAGLPDLLNKSAQAASVAATCAKKEISL